MLRNGTAEPQNSGAGGAVRPEEGKLPIAPLPPVSLAVGKYRVSGRGGNASPRSPRAPPVLGAPPWKDGCRLQLPAPREGSPWTGGPQRPPQISTGDIERGRAGEGQHAPCL